MRPLHIRVSLLLLLFIAASAGLPAIAAADNGWLRPGVRVWYLGAVDGGGVTSSNAEEAYLIKSVVGADAQVVHHAAQTHWTLPRPVESITAPVGDIGPCWIHPARLQTLAMGESYLGHEITLVQRDPYTYDTFPYHTLPINALFALAPTRQIVKLSYMLPGFSTGNAYFDADTGLLLYHHTVWGASKMFFTLSEINYDFARQAAFTEDDGPHTGFRSFVSERSLGSAIGVGGGSVTVQSLFETRYGATLEMRVMTSISGPYGAGMADENFCFFGDVPIVRAIDATQAPNLPPEQWTAFGQHLWWWLPRPTLATAAINVIDVPMARAAGVPATFDATQSPNRFHFTSLTFGADGYMTVFSAKAAAFGLDVRPTDLLFDNQTRVDGLDYYRASMATPAFHRPRDFDGDRRSDVAVYRPGSGTWFWLKSSASNQDYGYRGWGVQAQGDVPVVGDFDGDGLIDPTVFRPSSGTWFVLESHANFTTWNWFGWGNSTDTLVPGDYDGDGKTDAAVYRAATGTWYVRPANGATTWSVAFGQAGDVPIAGDFDGDGKRDVAVYRPASGTWFWLKSSTNLATYDYRGWGVQAQGDIPAPGDYDGDGITDLCVFRPASGTWFILESHAGWTTWNWFGWGNSTDTLVPADYDGDGRTDAAIYRPSTGEWFVKPSTGATPWNVVFGAAGDVPLGAIR